MTTPDDRRPARRPNQSSSSSAERQARQRRAPLFQLTDDDIAPARRGPPAPLGDLVDDIGQIDEILLFHFDHAQAAPRVLVQQRLDERRLSGAARAGEEHVFRGETCNELARILFHEALLIVDALEILEIDAMHVRHRFDRGAPVALAPPKRGRGFPVGRSRVRHERLLQALRRVLRGQMASAQRS